MIEKVQPCAVVSLANLLTIVTIHLGTSAEMCLIKNRDEVMVFYIFPVKY